MDRTKLKEFGKLVKEERTVDVRNKMVLILLDLYNKRIEDSIRTAVNLKTIEYMSAYKVVDSIFLNLKNYECYDDDEEFLMYILSSDKIPLHQGYHAKIYFTLDDYTDGCLEYRVFKNDKDTIGMIRWRNCSHSLSLNRNSISDYQSFKSFQFLKEDVENRFIKFLEGEEGYLNINTDLDFSVDPPVEKGFWNWLLSNQTKQRKKLYYQIYIDAANSMQKTLHNALDKVEKDNI